MKLSHHCISALVQCLHGPEPTQRFNPGVVQKLVKEGLAGIEMRPSPYIRSRSSNIGHLVLTETGRKVAKEKA